MSYITGENTSTSSLKRTHPADDNSENGKRSTLASAVDGPPQLRNTEQLQQYQSEQKQHFQQQQSGGSNREQKFSTASAVDLLPAPEPSKTDVWLNAEDETESIELPEEEFEQGISLLTKVYTIEEVANELYGLEFEKSKEEYIYKMNRNIAYPLEKIDELTPVSKILTFLRACGCSWEYKRIALVNNIKLLAVFVSERINSANAKQTYYNVAPIDKFGARKDIAVIFYGGKISSVSRNSPSGGKSFVQTTYTSEAFEIPKLTTNDPEVLKLLKGRQLSGMLKVETPEKARTMSLPDIPAVYANGQHIRPPPLGTVGSVSVRFAIGRFSRITFSEKTPDIIYPAIVLDVVCTK